MNTALLVRRIVPGFLLFAHGLQKLVPPRYSPPLLHAMGPRGHQELLRRARHPARVAGH